MRISDWSSDVFSSDLCDKHIGMPGGFQRGAQCGDGNAALLFHFANASFGRSFSSLQFSLREIPFTVAEDEEVLALLVADQTTGGFDIEDRKSQRLNSSH